MERKTLLGMVLALFVALVPVPALASTSSLPSSDEAIQRGWTRMNPTTFAVSHTAVLEQYDRVAKLDSRLTAEKRARLAAMLEAGEEDVVSVPDGIGLDYLTGRFEASPFVYVGMVKKLGRNDRAVLYDLGDGVYLYWFTGEKGKSCNNIGIVIKTPPVVVTETPPPPKVHKVVCQMVTVEKRGEPTGEVFIPGLYLAECWCDVFYTPTLYLAGGSSDKMTIQYQVCS